MCFDDRVPGGSVEEEAGMGCNQWHDWRQLLLRKVSDDVAALRGGAVEKMGNVGFDDCCSHIGVHERDFAQRGIEALQRALRRPSVPGFYCGEWSNERGG